MGGKSKNQPESSIKTNRGAAKTKKDPNKPKHATTAFFFFAQEERSNVRAANPNLKITEISKILGNIWREMDNKSKARFREMAERDKMRYKKEKAVYDRKVVQEN